MKLLNRKRRQRSDLALMVPDKRRESSLSCSVAASLRVGPTPNPRHRTMAGASFTQRRIKRKRRAKT